MLIKVLGSAAGGGFPQWNCYCGNCRGFREGTFSGKARSQTQLAFSPDGAAWFLLGASPDLRTQLNECSALAPNAANDGAVPIGGVFLPSADVDAVMGLLHLREFQTFFVFSTQGVQRILEKENRIFRVLQRAEPAVQFKSLALNGRLGFHLSDDSSTPPSFVCTAIPAGGHYPDYASDELQRNLAADEAVVNFVIERTGKRFLFAPTLSGSGSEWKKAAESCDVIFVDGTFWSDDELIRTGRSAKTARAIGHLPLSGPNGMLEQFPAQIGGRKILIHINNTNPILDETSAEHRAVRDAGFEIAYDGMEISL